jgi:hypothetical protein
MLSFRLLPPGIEIVEGPRNDGVVVLNDTEFYAEKYVSPNMAADLFQHVVEEAVTVFEGAAVLVPAVVNGNKGKPLGRKQTPNLCRPRSPESRRPWVQ